MSISIYKKHNFFENVHWDSAKTKKDIVDLIFGKDVHPIDSKNFYFSNLKLSSLCLYRKKTFRIFENIFFPQHANELNIPNILKYASNGINSFIYPNKFYYIVDSNMLQYYIVETFQQNSSVQKMALGLLHLENSFVGFNVYGVIYSPKVKIFSI